jgi:hypothetical protein
VKEPSLATETVGAHVRAAAGLVGLGVLLGILHHPSIVARVARRLISTEQSVGAIAYETGFANANHCCRVFRQ